ncbi:hypothetical protein GBF38_001711 [Nibea albiflora]|uniref:Uncharacterized protein n=1 Tax=Nibea albiflora TaxID=240163 RepID=A0ACB7EUM5_NIBAL|nr:hypothetical protein GBF38_001711 [Nibea albiflora]
MTHSSSGKSDCQATDADLEIEPSPATPSVRLSENSIAEDANMENNYDDDFKVEDWSSENEGRFSDIESCSCVDSHTDSYGADIKNKSQKSFDIESTIDPHTSGSSTVSNCDDGVTKEESSATPASATIHPVTDRGPIASVDEASGAVGPPVGAAANPSNPGVEKKKKKTLFERIRKFFYKLKAHIFSLCTGHDLQNQNHMRQSASKKETGDGLAAEYEDDKEDSVTMWRPPLPHINEQLLPAFPY